MRLIHPRSGKDGYSQQLGLIVLLSSAFISGYSGKLGQQAAKPAAPAAAREMTPPAAPDQSATSPALAQ